ncbi:MAG: hypothetical protein PVJ03_09680 [Chromatiaceae bacterium]
MNRKLVDQCVENLCEKGCQAVWSDIRALEAGQALSEVEGLSAAERMAVIAELKAVMSVYEGHCRPTQDRDAERRRPEVQSSVVPSRGLPARDR